MALNSAYIDYDKAEIKRILSRRQHLRFMQYCWRKPFAPFVVGIHTRAICQAIDKAICDFSNGISSFLIIKVCFRHGKSDIISRYLPPHFLGMFPDNEVMLVTYGQSLAEGMSRDAQDIMRTDTYAALYPNVKLRYGNSSVRAWGKAAS